MARTCTRFVRLVIGIGLLLLALGSVLTALAAPTRCFSETGQCIGDPLSDFWQNNGGLPVFGFPITTMAPEIAADNGQPYVTQWLERERLELHPKNAPPYAIVLGRLGAERLTQTGRHWQSFPKASPSAAHYYTATGHAIAPPFWDYWRSHGLELGDAGLSERESLALFGYPLSEPAMEQNAAGGTFLTQWFERARFEYHPENAAPHTVLLGLLGNEVKPAGPPATPPSYEDRTDVTTTLLSYYNNINRREYQRAYNYWETAGTSATSVPPEYTIFVRGYVDTTSVAVTIGMPIVDAGAGNVWATAPVVLQSTMLDGSARTFAGCYTLHHTNPGVDPRPDAALWKLVGATISAVTDNPTPATLLSAQSCPPTPRPFMP